MGFLLRGSDRVDARANHRKFNFKCYHYFFRNRQSDDYWIHVNNWGLQRYYPGDSERAKRYKFGTIQYCHVHHSAYCKTNRTSSSTGANHNVDQCLRHFGLQVKNMLDKLPKYWLLWSLWIYKEGWPVRLLVFCAIFIEVILRYCVLLYLLILCIITRARIYAKCRVIINNSESFQVHFVS